jgi:formylmethanofuran dehydrogenase subunit E
LSHGHNSSHRPKREEAKTREVVDLKRENHQLKRAVKRLEKEIRKRAEVEEEVAEPEPLAPQEVCPECESNLKLITVGPVTLKVCHQCKWRTKVA